MVIIDKTLQSNRLLFTLKENTTIATPIYLLVLHSPFNKTTSRFILQNNTSPFTFRYDEFIIETLIFKDLTIGTYYYSVYQTSTESLDETTMGKAVETGILKVVGEAVEGYVSISPVETTDDFLVYEK